MSFLFASVMNIDERLMTVEALASMVLYRECSGIVIVLLYMIFSLFSKVALRDLNTFWYKLRV